MKMKEMVLATNKLDELREDVSKSQKKGLPFIFTSVIIWFMILIVAGLDSPINIRNMLTFCCSCPLLPCSYMIGKILKVDIFEKKNPLSKLGFLFTCNQMLYLLIVMWVFSAVPEKMVMVYAMVFGAHLMPYSWLYQSKAYMFFAIIEPVIALAAGCIWGSQAVAVTMIVAEIIFSSILVADTKVYNGNNLASSLSDNNGK